MSAFAKMYAALVAGLGFAALLIQTAQDRGSDSRGHWQGYASLGGFWWVIVGVVIGLTLGAAIHIVATRPWRWRVAVQKHYGARVNVVVRRWFSTVTCAEINAGAEDFDDQLHRARAEASGKAAAMNVAGRR